MEINNLIGKNAVYSGAFDIEWQSIECKINQHSVDDLFLAQTILTYMEAYVIYLIRRGADT